jgi:hypothetical protein
MKSFKKFDFRSENGSHSEMKISGCDNAVAFFYPGESSSEVCTLQMLDSLPTSFGRLFSPI